MTLKTSLSQKVLLSIGSLVILALLVILYISDTIILTSFARLEEQEARTNVERVQKSIDGELESLVAMCGDWAPWDDSRDFMLGRAPDYNTVNLTAGSLANLNLNLMLFIDTSGKLFHTVAIDVEKEDFAQAPSALIESILACKSLLNIKDPKESISGLIILPGETFLLAAQPISNSHVDGPISGTLIMGRYLTDDMINALSEKTRLNIEVVSGPNKAGASDDFKYANRVLSKDNNIAVRILDKNVLAGYTSVYGLNGNEHIILKTNMPRNIYHYGRRTVRYFMTAIICVTVAILVALMLIMQKIVLQPINNLTGSVVNIRHHYDADTSLYTNRKDEIGSLARSFDLLMQNLQNKISDLDDSRNLVTSIIDTDPAYIFVKDSTGRYILVNKAMAELWNSTPQDMTGKTDMDFIGSVFSSAEQVNNIAEDDRKIIQTGKALFVKDLLFAPPKGWKRWLQIYKIPITIKGNADCVLGISIDITERKKNEDATNALNRQLVKITEKLEKTNDELGNFIYITSHDLKEPLRKISIFAQMLKQSLENKLNDDDAENLHFMIEGAGRMTTMIAGLSAYSKISAHTKPFQTVDLNQTVEQVQKSELAGLLENGQAVLDVPESLPAVKADSAQMRQLLQNFIENGIKYRNKQNRPHITITSKPAADGMVRIEITDNGIGIKPEYLSSIFTIFKRLHPADEYEGAGIGLAICKKIIERHDGQIGVESEPGKGSTFWFTLPFVKNAVAIPV